MQRLKLKRSKIQAVSRPDTTNQCTHSWYVQVQKLKTHSWINQPSHKDLYMLLLKPKVVVLKIVSRRKHMLRLRPDNFHNNAIASSTFVESNGHTDHLDPEVFGL